MPEIGDTKTTSPISHSAADNGRDSQDSAQTPYGSPSVNWAELVSRIRRGDEDATAELYKLFVRGIRFYLCRQLGVQDLDDKVHDVFLIVVKAIRRGAIREPDRLMGFVRTIVRREVAAAIAYAVQRRREQQADVGSEIRLVDHALNPEENAIQQQRVKLIRSILHKMSSRDQEILTRFYLHEQPLQQICQQMHLTETQFRLLKSRAKARFSEVGKKKLKRPILGILRTPTFACRTTPLR